MEKSASEASKPRCNDGNIPRTFLITGCAGGIGRALVDGVVARGDRVVATDVAVDALREAEQASGWPADRVLTRPLDVRDAEAWQAVVAEAVATFGRLDVLINNAGVLLPGNMIDLTPDQIALHVDVNTKGTMLGTQAAAKVMIDQGGGHIINLGSFAALGPIPGIAVYGGTKYAVRGFSLAVAEELRPHDIAISIVCPESVRTPMLDREAACEDSALALSAPKFLTPQDVAGLVLGRVLRKRPLEAYIPSVRGRFARLMDLIPGTAAWLALPGLRRRGRKRQETWGKG